MRLKHYIILLIVLSLFIPVTIATSTETNIIEFQNTPKNTGATGGIADFSDGIGITYTIAAGMGYQALVADITGNSDLEVVIYNGNYLQLYDKELNPIDEKFIGKPVYSQPIIYDNGTDYIMISVHTDGVLEGWYYNGTTFLDGFTNSSSLNQSYACPNGFSSWKCLDGFCYVASEGIDNRGHIYKINMTSYTWLDANTSARNPAMNPAIGEIDGDGSNEMVFRCDPDNDGQIGICVVDVNGSGLPYLDIGFSADGIIDDIEGDAGAPFASPSIVQVDGLGAYDIVVSYGGANIKVYKGDGTQIVSAAHATGGVTNPGQAVEIFNGSGAGGVNTNLCSIGYNGVNNLYILCVNSNDDKIVEKVITGYSGLGADGMVVMVANMDGDSDNVQEMVTGAGIFRFNGDIMLNTTSDNNYWTSLADVNRDGELDIVYTKSGSTKIMYSTFSNTPPVLDNDLSYGGYGNNYGYSTPVCINSTITFSAADCYSFLSCNYINDRAIDEERIVSNCGQNGDGTPNTLFTTNLANGTSSISSPQFQCYYNRTGIFNVRLYLQDNYDFNDYSQYNTQTISINVINGQPGITCNIINPVNPGETVPSTTTPQQAQTNEAIDDTFGILFGTGAQSDKLKLIVGLAIVISITIWAAKEGLTSGIGLLAIALVTTVLVTFLGLLTPAILLIVLMSLVLLMLFSKFISPSAGEGG